MKKSNSAQEEEHTLGGTAIENAGDAAADSSTAHEIGGRSNSGTASLAADKGREAQEWRRTS
jgi:hypothetical protein